MEKPTRKEILAMPMEQGLAEVGKWYQEAVDARGVFGFKSIVTTVARIVMPDGLTCEAQIVITRDQEQWAAHEKRDGLPTIQVRKEVQP